MGCCIGKLRKGSKKQEGQVYDGFRRKPDVSVDKVVITESPILSPSDVTYSSSYLPYSSKSFIPSSSSSTSSLKDRTFSNEFLVSCLKENPQVVTQLNHVPATSPKHSVFAAETHPKVVYDYKPPKSSDHSAFDTRSLGRRTPQRLEWHKSPSPSPARRKFPIPRDQETPKYYSSTRKAGQLRYPSPSRRFNNNSTKTSNYKVRRVGTSQQSSPFNDRVTSTVYSAHHRRRQGSMYEDAPGANRQVSSSALIGEMECMTLEDLDNPLISLDCFIFL